LRSDDSKNASAAAYLLLRFALFEVYKINEPVEFEIAPRGKPTLKKYPHIHFNLSHSKGVAACVVADFEVGVDVQSIKSVSSKTAKRVATAQEYKEFLTAESPDDYFCKIWTIKESYVKMTGQGLTTEFRDISAEKIPNIYTFKGNGYYCSTCGSQRFGDETSASVRNIRREDFELLYR
jgi:4'-phosphopantetheinyl transferase